jgi:uncharacterized membrane protein YeaQ/YmgE (transglycosylase-associated protein family)
MNAGENRTALVVGILLSAVMNVVFFVVPALVPLEALKRFLWQNFQYSPRGNPFTDLRVLGGLPGGFVAGYLVTDEFGRDRWPAAMFYGIAAAVGGTVLVYVLWVLVLLGRWMILRSTAPPLVSSVTLPLLVVFPFVLVSLLVGGIAGLLGNGLRILVTELVTPSR